MPIRYYYYDKCIYHLYNTTDDVQIIFKRNLKYYSYDTKNKKTSEINKPALINDVDNYMYWFNSKFHVNNNLMLLQVVIDIVIHVLYHINVYCVQHSDKDIDN